MAVKRLWGGGGAGVVICLQPVANDLHNGLADATATPSSLALLKTELV